MHVTAAEFRGAPTQAYISFSFKISFFFIRSEACINGHELNNYREGTGKVLRTFVEFLPKQHLWKHFNFRFPILIESVRRQ